MAKRTDIHRKGAIIPGEYSHVLSYNLATIMDGWPIPSFGVNCELDGRVTTKNDDGSFKVINGKHSEDGTCCVVGMRAAGIKFSEYGSAGKCTACGSHFVYGEVWKHEPTGEHVHLGHICGAKYGLMVDRSAFELEAGRRARAVATQLEKERKAEERVEFLADHPGLEEALETDHHIVADIKSRFIQWCNLSDAQIALVMKLHKEDKERSEAPQESHCAAPEGKQVFQGVVVSKRAQHTQWGCSIKLTVKVTTPEGVYLVWGTCPAALLYSNSEDPGAEQGDTVELKATLTRSDRDEHFAFMKRPSGKIIKKAEKK